MTLLKLLTGVLSAPVAMLGRTPSPPPAPPPASRPISEGDRAALGRGVPGHWPPRYNSNTEPCDMTDGPCACGAWHDHGDEWVRNGVEWFGARPRAG